MGYRPRGRKESGMTEHAIKQAHTTMSPVGVGNEAMASDFAKQNKNACKAYTSSSGLIYQHFICLFVFLKIGRKTNFRL